METNNPRYWIGVVSKSHVMRGVEGGFAQLCHGKAAPLRRMKQGDWLIYYSPKTDLYSGEPLQAFTAIGTVRDDAVYEYPMSESFIPFRRNIHFYDCKEAPIHPLLNKMNVTKENCNWGYRFRSGHFEIGQKDFEIISAAMGVETTAAVE